MCKEPRVNVVQIRNSHKSVLLPFVVTGRKGRRGGKRREREKIFFRFPDEGTPPLPFIKIGYIAHIAVFGAKKLSLFSFDPLGY